MGELVQFEEHRAARSAAPLLAPPPHDLEAEGATLSACLLDGNARADGGVCDLDRVLEMLGPEHFYMHENGQIFQGLQALRTARTPIDLGTMNTWLRDRKWAPPEGFPTWAKYLEKLAHETAAITNVDEYARSVLDKWELRQIITTCLRVAAEARVDVGVQAEFKAAARRDLGVVTAPRMRLAGAPIGTVVDAARAHIEQVQRGEVLGVHPGFGEIERIAGHFIRGEQTVLGGRPSMGKTELAFQIVRHVARRPEHVEDTGEAVYVASFEMPARSLILRAACIAAGVDTQAVRSKSAHPDDLVKVGRYMSALRRLPIIIDDDPCTTAALAGRVRARKATFESGKARDERGELYGRCRMQLVMVDYVQNVPAPEHMARASLREKVGAAAVGLVEHVAKGCDVATLVLAMMGRIDDKRAGTPEGRVPLLSDLKESGAIEESADTVLLLHREHFYTRSKCPAALKNVAHIIGAKGRFGMPEDNVAVLGWYRGRFANELPHAARGESHYDGDE